VSRTFGAFKALDGVSIEIADGELLAVLGPSGCGKTTLLRLIAGFDPVSSGSISIGDRVVSSTGTHVVPEERRVGIVFQSYALWPHMTVAENVGYALKVAKVPRADREKQVAGALALVGLDGFGERPPAMLSGGQRQRVALARCLVMRPSLVLLDEPLANLDVHLRAAMEAEFADFHRRTGTTMIYITHDQAEAMALADRIAVLDKGRLLQVASPSALYREPAGETVARFIGEGMILSAEITGHVEDGRIAATICGLATAVRGSPGQHRHGRGRVCLRPRNLRLAAAGEAALEARVLHAVYRGGAYRIEADAAFAPGETLRLDVAEPTGIRVGDTVRIAITDGWLLPESVTGDKPDRGSGG
jgi:iron(III) transport system ATP-binding protein